MPGHSEPVNLEQVVSPKQINYAKPQENPDMELDEPIDQA